MEAASEFTSKLGNRNGFRRSAPSERSGQIRPSRNGRMDAIGSKGTTHRCYATLAGLARRSAWWLARSSAPGCGGGLQRMGYVGAERAGFFYSGADAVNRRGDGAVRFAFQHVNYQCRIAGAIEAGADANADYRGVSHQVRRMLLFDGFGLRDGGVGDGDGLRLR